MYSMIVNKVKINLKVLKEQKNIIKDSNLILKLLEKRILNPI